MDPLSALSIAASLVQFIDFSSRLLIHTREIYHSAKGQTEETVELSTVASDLSELSRNIKAQSDSLRKASPAQGSSEEKLLRVCLQYRDVSQALEDALDQLRLKDVEAASGTKLFYFGRKLGKHLNSFFLALREVWAAKEMNAWRDLLSRLREELTTALLAVLWEKSQQTSKDMGEMSGQLETVLATLRNVEGTTRSLNDSLVQQLANPIASSGTPKHAALIDAVWSSAWSSSTVAAVTKTYSPTQDELYFDVSEHDDTFCGNAITESLRFRSSDARETAIPNAYQQTYKWIFEKPQQGVRTQRTWSSFVSWLEEPSTDIYWITGKPGAGKSTLMKFIVEHPDLRDYLSRWSDLSGKPLVLASFYFWNAGPLQMQKSQQGLLRILLAQCISQIPALAAKVCPTTLGSAQDLRPPVRADGAGLDHE
ncbi:hypothetical protein AK830_g275 [Neonectria ditissima]|uniref:Nephrocystin 3-like N-terminal domain-containing protein n=1 Tax=Neonectria ditissima TaxID=78410 RepID=A0A0P7BX96_9HYPO|nr:hypothetical protein AK830_g275 [Neonectria ditissima]